MGLMCYNAVIITGVWGVVVPLLVSLLLLRGKPTGLIM